jgi:hypothetical protein
MAAYRIDTAAFVGKGQRENFWNTLALRSAEESEASGEKSERLPFGAGQADR